MLSKHQRCNIRRMLEGASMVVARVTLTLYSGEPSHVPGFWGRMTAVGKAGSEINSAVWKVGEGGRGRASSSEPWKKFQ